MDKKEELKQLLREVNQDVLDVVKDQNVKIDEQIAKMKEESVEMRTKIEAIESAPARKVALDVPGSPGKTVDFMYKGYDLRRQGVTLDIADESVKNDIAKMFINMIHGKTALNEGTDAQGGYLVPEEYADAVFAFARLTSVALQECDVISTSTDSFNIPAELTGITVSWKTETTAVAASDPTYANVNLTPAKLGAYSTASNELLMDSKYDIVSRLTSQYGEAIGQELDKQTFIGSQFTKLEGAAGINYVRTAADGTSTDDIDFILASNAIAQIPSNKIMGAKFYMHRTFVHIFRSMVDSNNRPIMSTEQGSFFIYGYPVVFVEALPTGTANNALIGFFGNMKYYAIARRLGDMSLDVDPYGKFLEYQTRFRSVTRWDGAPTGASAFSEMRI